MKSSLMTEFFFCSPAIVTPAQVGISILKTRNCVEMSFTFNQADTDAAFLRPRVPRSERRSMPGAVEYSLCYGAMTVLPFVSYTYCTSYLLKPRLCSSDVGDWTRSNVPPECVASISRARQKIDVCLSSINQGIPDPSTWGTPAAIFPATSCNIDKYFKDQQLVMNVDLCGESWCYWGRV